MSKINQIQNAIRELEGGAFQKLAELYLYKKGYQQINSIGSMLGSNKVRKGTPDSLISRPDGKYVFGEHTTTAQDKLFNKFKGDISKCFDENKTGIAVSNIAEVVLCHTSGLSSKEVNFLREICSFNHVDINIFGCSEISYDLLEKYPIIAKDHLNIEVDTGQIVDLEKFIDLYDKNKSLSTSLQTKFYGRKNDKQHILQLMETLEMVVVSGAAGVGKSRLVIECFREFSEKNGNYKAYCIYNKGIDIFEDLKSYFADSGNYLIFVDDANRISGFSYILQLLREKRTDQSFKVIATVRDYASDKLIETAKAFTSLEEVVLNKFEDKEIKELLSTTLGIENSRYQDRILEIAEGNPRLAIMAGKIAVDNQFLESIHDVSGIYDAFFASIKNDLEALNDGILLKVAGIVSFFRHVDMSNKEQMDEIKTVFNISSNEFWKYAKQLHYMEIFDLYEDEVVKLSDQVLATYIFYLVFIKEGHLEFALLLEHFFPQNRKKIIDAINPVFNAFDFPAVKESINISVDRHWRKLKIDDGLSFLQFIDCFWFMKPTDTLIYIKEKIDLSSIKRKDNFIDSLFDVEKKELPQPFNVLPRFKFGAEDEFRLSLALLFQYGESQPEMSGRVVYSCTEYFGFDPESYNHYYKIQQLVSEELISKSEEGHNLYFSKLFITVAENYLHTDFSSTRAARNNTFSMWKFDLIVSDELTELRNNLLVHLIKLAQLEQLRESVLSLFYKYSHNWHNIDTAHIIKKDLELIQPFILESLSPQKLYHCEIVQSYVKRLKRLDVSYLNELETVFNSATYKLYDLLLNENDRAELRLGYEQYIEHRTKKIKKVCINFRLVDYVAFFDELIVLISKSENGRNEWLLEQGLIALFEGLSETNVGLFKRVIAEYLKFTDRYKVSPYKIVMYLLKPLSKQQVYSLIDSQIFETKASWLSAYYIHLKAEDIESTDINAVLNLYSEAPISAFFNNFEYLLNYEKRSKGFVVRVVSIIVERAVTEPNIGSVLRTVFNDYTEYDREFKALVSENIELLRRAYISASISNGLFDYDGTEFGKILDLSPDFMMLYLSQSEDKNNRYDGGRDYTFIWLRDDFSTVMEQVDKHFLSNEKHYGIYREYQNFFQKGGNPQQDKNVIEKQNRYLKNVIKVHNKNRKYMDILFRLIQELEVYRKPQFYEAFLDSNDWIEDFKSLRFEQSFMSWSGSMIPLLDAKIKFYEQVKILCNSVELLEHRGYLEQLVDRVRETIALQKKKEYMNDF